MVPTSNRNKVIDPLPYSFSQTLEIFPFLYPNKILIMAVIDEVENLLIKFKDQGFVG
jgi:hypothetical protein